MEHLGAEEGDAIRLDQAGYSTGTLYVDGLSSEGSVFGISALSMPQSARAAASRVWEDIRLLAIAADMAGRHGLKLEVYEAPNPTYRRVEQLNQPDMAWLNSLCLRESCCMKLAGDRLIIYSEPAFERKAPAASFHKSQLMGSPRFVDEGAGLMQACVVTWQDGKGGQIMGKATAPVSGGTLTIQERVTSPAEAARFAAGYLRQANKRDSGEVAMPLSAGLTGGNTVAISGTGLGDGRHFVTRAAHDFIRKETRLYLRRPMEGVS